MSRGQREGWTDEGKDGEQNLKLVKKKIEVKKKEATMLKEKKK